MWLLIMLVPVVVIPVVALVASKGKSGVKSDTGTGVKSTSSSNNIVQQAAFQSMSRSVNF